MAYAKKSNYSSASRPSQGGEVKGNNEVAVERDPATQTTHYAKVNGDYANGVFIWENEGEFGTYLKMRITETLQPGDYFVSRKKGA